MMIRKLSALFLFMGSGDALHSMEYEETSGMSSDVSIFEKRGMKRKRDDEITIESKRQKNDFIVMDQYLSSLSDQEKIKQIETLVKQTPSFHFWQPRENNNNLVTLQYPTEEFRNSANDSWFFMRHILEKQLLSSSPTTRADLVKIILRNLNHLGSPSLIAEYVAMVCENSMDSKSLHYYRTLLKIFIQYADEQSIFDSFYYVLNSSDASNIVPRFKILFDAGAKPLVKDNRSKSYVIAFFAKNDSSKFQELPEELFRLFAKYSTSS